MVFNWNWNNINRTRSARIQKTTKHSSPIRHSACYRCFNCLFSISSSLLCVVPSNSVISFTAKLTDSICSSNVENWLALSVSLHFAVSDAIKLETSKCVDRLIIMRHEKSPTMTGSNRIACERPVDSWQQKLIFHRTAAECFHVCVSAVLSVRT